MILRQYTNYIEHDQEGMIHERMMSKVSSDYQEIKKIYF